MSNQKQNDDKDVLPFPGTPSDGGGGGGNNVLGERVARIEGLMQHVATKEEFGRIDTNINNLQSIIYKLVIPLIATVLIIAIAIASEIFLK